MSATSEDRLELEIEFEKVSQELLQREVRLKAIEEEVVTLKYKLQAIQESLGIASGDTAKVVMSQRYKRKLLLDVDRKRKHRTQVQEEVDRARERLVKVRDLLQQQPLGVEEETLEED